MRLCDAQITGALPGEAALTVEASLLHWQHVRVRLAGEQQLSNFKGSGNAETSPSPRTVEPLDSLDAARHRASSSESLLRAGTRESRGVM